MIPAPRQPDPTGRTKAEFPSLPRIQQLLTELDQLLRGSLHATSTLDAPRSAMPTTLLADSPASLNQQLHAAAQRLEHMADLVHSAMQSASKPLGAPSMSRSRPVTLGEAAQHAADVLSPLAAAHHVTIALDVAAPLAQTPAGALYSVILNGLQNAVESIARRGGPGRVGVVLRAEPAPAGVGYGKDGRDWYSLEITDDGAGLPSDATRCFDLGYTTKPKGTGVGLAVAKNIIRGMGGTIELMPRDGTPGATLRVCFPGLTSAAHLALGGAA